MTICVWGTGTSNVEAIRDADSSDRDAQMVATRHNFDVNSGENWSVYVDADVDTGDLDRDPAVVAYCEICEHPGCWQEYARHAGAETEMECAQQHAEMCDELRVSTLEAAQAESDYVSECARPRPDASGAGEYWCPACHGDYEDKEARGHSIRVEDYDYRNDPAVKRLDK